MTAGPEVKEELVRSVETEWLELERERDTSSPTAEAGVAAIFLLGGWGSRSPAVRQVKRKYNY